jgi:uncharacterized protein YaaN involved in tellurite resistance
MSEQENANVNVEAVNTPKQESSKKNTEIVNTNTKNVNLGSTDMKKAEELSKQLDYKDMNSVVSFGTDVQKNISDSTSKILQHSKTADVGDVGNALGDLVLHIKSSNPEKSFATKILTAIGLSKLSNHVEKVKTACATVEENLGGVEARLDESRKELFKDNAILDDMYSENESFILDNKINIAAIKIKINEINGTVIPDLEKAIKAEKNDTDRQLLENKKNQINNFLTRLDKRLLNLQLTGNQTSQSLYRLDIMKTGNLELSEKIQDGILMVLPEWRKQMAETILLQKQTQIATEMRGFSDLTNELIMNNAKTTRDNMKAIATESERSMIDIKTLQASNAELIGTINDVIEIKKKGAKERAEVRKQLSSMDSDMKKNIEDIQKVNIKSIQDSEVFTDFQEAEVQEVKYESISSDKDSTEG